MQMLKYRYVSRYKAERPLVFVATNIFDVIFPILNMLAQGNNET